MLGESSGVAQLGEYYDEATKRRLCTSASAATMPSGVANDLLLASRPTRSSPSGRIVAKMVSSEKTASHRLPLRDAGGPVYYRGRTWSSAIGDAH